MKKIKKRLGLITAAILIFSALNLNVSATDSGIIMASPVECSLFVDGGEKYSPQAYEIDGGMYFKLRDIAAALNTTDKQFEVSWATDNGYMEVNLLSKTAYTLSAGELSYTTGQGISTAIPSTASFYCDALQAAIPAYLIDETHYVKLSDIAATLKFASDWDAGTRTAKIITSPKTESAGDTGGYLDNIALLYGRNSYYLDKDGTLIILYHNGTTMARAPVKISEGGAFSAYISDDKTAIVYGGNTALHVSISDDMGETWSTYEASSAKDLVGSKYISFITKDDGFLVASPGSSAGASYNFVFKTSDGGKTWTQIGNPNGICPRNATGAGFSTKDIGFISYRTDDGFGPDICRTTDGGYTWEKLETAIPEGYDYNTPLSPVFCGAMGVYPIEYHDRSDDGDEKIITYYLTSSDYGKTWVYDEAYNLACQWAGAVKARDGRAQYDLMSRELQEKSYDDYEAFNWVTGASSPWVESFIPRIIDDGAAVTYRWASSAGSDGVSSAALSFVREDGALRVNGVIGTQIGDKYEHMGLIVLLPEDYNLKVKLTSSPELGGEGIIEAFHQPAMISEYPSLGLLFRIVQHTPAAFEDYWPGKDMVGGARHFAKDSEYYYSLETPTDVQADVETEGMLEEYMALYSEIDSYIIPKFIEVNHLSAYDHSAEIYEPEYTYPGNHAIFSVTLSSGSKSRLILSQPVRQGEGGIWCVERMYDDGGNLHIAMPETDLTVMEYYTRMQAEADEGHRSGLLDTEDVALTYLADVWDWIRHISEYSIEYITD